MAADFKPSDVVLGHPPLIGTMGRSEVECAVAIVIRCLALEGDTWTMSEEAMVAAFDENDAYLSSLQRNPFLQPDFFAAEKAGYLAKVEGGVTVTEKGRDAVRTFVRAPVPAAPPAGDTP